MVSTPRPATQERSIPDPPQVSVCICTFRRPEGLRLLLESLTRQENAPPFEVIVVDNEPGETARAVASSFLARLDLTYLADASPCLARARNRSVQAARGDVLAFADDDEEVPPAWLATHLATLHRFNAAATSGPVRYVFDPHIPDDIRGCRIFQRPALPTFANLPWFWAFTGNACIRRSALPDPNHPFAEHFGRTGGEDVDCFKRIAEAGGRLVFSGPDTCVTEHRDHARANHAWIRRRALRNGGNLADMQWQQETRLRRVHYAAMCVKQGLAQTWRARGLARHQPVEALNQRIDAWMNFGRALAVFGYRYPEYGARR